ncbi:MAG: hypothetical protein JWN72_1159 [Thermoleophilia bacterium]|nr:hypothetical protein [Thermoleophilia bacterium]
MQHEGLVGWATRSVRELPGRIVQALLGFIEEVGRVFAGIGRGVLRMVPGGSLLLRRTAPTDAVDGGARASSAGSDWLDSPPRGRAGAGRAGLGDAELKARARRRTMLVRRLRVAGAALALVLLAIGAYVVPRAHVFDVGHVEIEGASAVSDLAVRQRVDSLLAGQTIFTVDEAAIARRIEELPFVRSVAVDHHLPDGLGIRIVEYRPLALACGDKACWLVAPDGRILTKVSASEWRGRVPVVRLESTSKVRPGVRLPQEPGLALLLAVPHDSTLDFATIDVSPYSVVATTGEGIEVRFGRAEHFASKLAAAERILTSASARAHPLAYVDVSVPSNPATCYQADALCRDAPTTTEVAEAHATKVAAQKHVAALLKSGAPQQEVDEATFAMNNPELVMDAPGGDATSTSDGAASDDSPAAGGASDARSADATGTAAQAPKDAFEAATRAE